MELDETNPKDQFYLMRQKMKKLMRQSEDQTEIMKRILNILNDESSSIASPVKCRTPGTTPAIDRKFGHSGILLSADSDIYRR